MNNALLAVLALIILSLIVKLVRVSAKNRAIMELASAEHAKASKIDGMALGAYNRTNVKAPAGQMPQ